MFNKVILVGRITRDPELRYTPNGRPVATFGIALDRPRAQGAERETDFFDLEAWQQTAEFAAKYATKGRLVAIDGRLKVRQYETQDGQKRKAYEIVVNDLRLLDRKDAATGGGSAEGGSHEAPAREPVSVYSGAPAPAPVDAGPGDMGMDDIPF